MAYATAANNVAADGDGRNSPFTAAFLKYIGTPDIDLRQTFFRIQDEVVRVTGGAQRPELSISLVGEYKLRITAAPTPTEIAKKPVETGPIEAERVWIAMQNTTSIAVLTDFIRQFDKTPYGSMARARLEELKKNQELLATQIIAPMDPVCDRIVGTWKWSSWLLGPTEATFFPDGFARHSGGRLGKWSCADAIFRVIWNNGVADRGKISQEEKSIQLTDTLGKQFTAQRRN